MGTTGKLYVGGCTYTRVLSYPATGTVSWISKLDDFDNSQYLSVYLAIDFVIIKGAMATSA
jgi:hypothetical protein